MGNISSRWIGEYRRKSRGRQRYQIILCKARSRWPPRTNCFWESSFFGGIDETDEKSLNMLCTISIFQLSNKVFFYIQFTYWHNTVDSNNRKIQIRYQLVDHVLCEQARALGWMRESMVDWVLFRPERRVSPLCQHSLLSPPLCHPPVPSTALTSMLTLSFTQSLQLSVCLFSMRAPFNASIHLLLTANHRLCGPIGTSRLLSRPIFATYNAIPTSWTQSYNPVDVNLPLSYCCGIQSLSFCISFCWQLAVIYFDPN